MPEVKDQKFNNLRHRSPRAALFQKEYGFIRMKVSLGDNDKKLSHFMEI